MKIAFRTDASLSIGTGHVIRCARIASALKSRGHSVRFVTSNAEGNKNDWLRTNQFEVDEVETNSLAQSSFPSREVFKFYDWESDLQMSREKLSKFNADLIIIDHYSLDYRYHLGLRKMTSKIACVDDLANRRLDCDLLIDQNLYLENKNRYDALTPVHCLKKIGLSYNTLLLDQSFLEARSRAVVRSGQTRQVFVFLGGADIHNVTGRIIEQVKSLREINFLVVLGTTNPQLKDLQAKYQSSDNLSITTNVSMPKVILESDLAIGSSGVNGWERAFLGLPTLLTNTSDNQIESGDVLTTKGACEFYGNYPNNEIKALAERIPIVINDKQKLKEMSQAGLSLWNDDSLMNPQLLIDAIEELAT